MVRTAPLVLLLAAACEMEPLEQDGPVPPPGTRAPSTAPAGPSGSAAPATTSMPTPTPPTPEPVSAKCNDPGPAPLRRLTATELGNTIRDLVGFAPELPAGLAIEDSWWGSFDRVVAAEPPGPAVVPAWMELAERTAARAIAELPRLLPCDAQDRTEACAARFIERFGKRAFRRPLDGDEQQLFLALFRQGHAALDFTEGMRWTIEAILQSPQFHYHVALGERPAPGARTVPLGSHELAARLSYALWGTLPDDGLAALADAGPLDAGTVRREVERMLADPRGRRGTAPFFRQWLALGRIEHVAKDRRTAPFFTPAFQMALRQSAERFVDHVVWEDGGRLETLLRAPYMFAHPAGEPQRYGLAVPPGTDMVKTPAPPGQRAGVLTQPALLATNAWSHLSNPVMRGAFVLRQLLCLPLPPPPPDVDPLPPPPPNLATMTTRERLTLHTAPPCAPCHRLIDPLGFAFENFDGLGVHRTTEVGKPIDASGVIRNGSTEQPFTDVQDMTAKLAAREDTATCAATQWFRYGLGRDPEDGERCTVEGLRAQLGAAGGDLRALMVALTATPAFTHRRSVEGGAP